MTPYTRHFHLSAIQANLRSSSHPKLSMLFHRLKAECALTHRYTYTHSNTAYTVFFWSVGYTLHSQALASLRPQAWGRRDSGCEGAGPLCVLGTVSYKLFTHTVQILPASLCRLPYKACFKPGLHLHILLSTVAQLSI